MKIPLLLVCALITVPAHAAKKSLRLTGGPKSEDALRRFVDSDPRLKAKLDEAVKREEAFVAEIRDSDLHDSIAEVKPADRLQQLPGMKVPAAPSCRALADCATPELAADVPDAALLPDALRSLVRPWMLLQYARGSSVEISPADGSGDAMLVMKLKNLDSQMLTLNVSPRLLGGFKIWFDQPLVLAALYGRERDAVLKKSL